MKMLSIVLLTFTWLVMTTQGVEANWRSMTPAQLREWFQSRESLNLGGPEQVLGKADEVKERSLTEPRSFDLTRIYRLADGHQLELSYLRIGSSMAEEGFLFLRQYGVWKVDAAGVRSEVWKSKMILPNTTPAKIHAREPKSKGDMPEKMYEIKDGGVG